MLNTGLDFKIQRRRITTSNGSAAFSMRAKCIAIVSSTLNTHVDLKLPSTDGLICQYLGEGDSQAVSEKPLARFALDIKS